MTVDLLHVVELFGVALKDGRPEDVFGTADHLREYRRLARLTHPDRNGGDSAATAAFVALGELWKLALALLEAGTYGKERAPTVSIQTKTRVYTLLDRIGRDEIADRFRCRWDGGDGYARVVRKPRDNDLMRAEARALRHLADRAADYDHFLPTLVDSVGIRQSGGVIRHANIFQHEPGDWYSLQDVIARYPRGVDPRDMAWIWRRLLAVLGAAHRADAIHGSVLPANVLIEPTLHGLVISNWSFSVPRGGRVPAVSPAHRGWYAPEVLAKQPAGRGSDIYLAARTMLAISNPAALGAVLIPDQWPRTLRAFFRACFLDARRRPRDAWELLADFDAVLERTYGPRRYRPFTMKGGTRQGEYEDQTKQHAGL